MLLLQACAVVLDVPAGVLSDRWSRKGVLGLSMAALAMSAVLMGLSGPLSRVLGLDGPFGVFLCGVAGYAVHVVTYYSTSDALLYDSLMESGAVDDQGQPVEYTRLGGRCYAINLASYAIASLASGLVTGMIGRYDLVFLVAAAPAVAGLVVVATLREPQFRDATARRTLRASFGALVADVRAGSMATLASGLIKPLLLIMCLLWTVEAFKEGFGQIYFLDAAPTVLAGPALASVLFGVFYSVWAFGETRAGKHDGKINRLVFLTTLPLLVVGLAPLLVPNEVLARTVAIVAYMVQAYYAAILFRQITGQVHTVTPSNVRDSVMSLRSFVGRLVSCSALVLIGFLIEHRGVLWAVWLVTLFAMGALAYWVSVRGRYGPEVDGAST